MLQNIIGCYKRICFTFLVTILITNANGQPKCKVEFYSTEQGLSHQAVTDIIKDHEGFMWFGSWDGINRFDGHHFVSYKSSPGDKSQLGSDRVDQLVEDQADHLWMVAYDKQIYRFDKKNEQFLPLSNIIDSGGKHKIDFYRILTADNGWVWLQSKSDGIFCVPQNDSKPGHFIRFSKDLPSIYRLPSNTINIFHKDENDIIWVGTAEGLACLIPTKNGNYVSKQLPNIVASGENITAVDEDANCVYFGTASGNLVTAQKKTGRFSIQQITLGNINALCRSKLKDTIYAVTSLGEVVVNNLKQNSHVNFRVQTSEALYAVFEDRSGILWIEPDKLGVIRFQPSTQLFSHFSHQIDDTYKFIGDRFRFFEDNLGTVWINMKGGGFGYYNPSKDSIEYSLTTIDEGRYHLPEVVFNLFYDKAGILWLRTNGRELVKIVFQSNEFSQQPLADANLSIMGNEVRGIFQDNKDRLWLGTKVGKLYVYQDKKQLTSLFDKEPFGGFGLYSILQDSHGNVWIGTKGNGLYIAVPTNKEATNYKITHFKHDKNNPFSLNGDEIYSLLEDKQGRIWIGSFDAGLCFIEQIADSIRFVHTGNAFKNYPTTGFNKIRRLTLDQNGNIWIGTTDGLLLLDANDQHSSVYNYKSYRKVAGDAQSLGNNNVQFIFRDSKQKMWLATSGGGFCEAIGKNPLQSLTFKNYTTKDGMPNNYSLSCEEDKQGNIWIATENGLSKFNPKNKSFRNYDSYDGLSKVGFSEAAASHRSSNDELFFGTTNGYLSFAPEKINTKRITANIVLTNLQINNEDVVPSLDEGILQANINYANKLLLKYNQNIISIDYAILDYRSGSGGQAFAYRLLGFDTVWHDDRLQRRVTYTNLPPGNYVFEVKSLSTDLYSNQPYKKLAISILPPPWKTWWAYLLYGVFIVLVLYFIRHYEIVMMRLRNKIAVEQKLATLKMNFFTNVSHELRTPLTLIINPLEKLAKRDKLSPEDAGYIEVARKNANRMVRFINQLLDLRKVQSEKAVLHISRIAVVAFVKEVSGHFLEEARSKQIRLEIVEPNEDFFAFVDTEKLDVVIYNLLSNAFKFTPNNKIIRIAIEQFPEDGTFSISVNDQGAGVAKNKLEDIFELFHEEEQTKGKTLKGSGIGLALSREFVNLHDGKIWAENNEDGGLSVYIKLKLGKLHLNKQQVFFVDKHLDNSTIAETFVEQPLVLQPFQTNNIKDNETPLVLLVEDNDELRLFIGSQLGEFYRVETAKDGAEGLEKASELLPDLIVSDIMMPNLNGIEMLDQVKNNLKTSHIPVVLLSAKYSIESQIEGLKYGADYYITKPFNNEFLIASINNLLKQRKKLFEALVEKKKTITLSPSDIVVTSKDETFLKDVIQFVEEKMADTEFNIEAVAEAMAMTHKTFYKKFKSLTGVLPVEFVRDMRLQRAKQLLDSSQFNISEIAYTVGFSNPKYFSTCFKEKFKVSPSDYSKEKQRAGGLNGSDKLSFLNEVH